MPGLVLESGSFDALIERVRITVPELLELNGTAPAPRQLRMVSERCERLAMQLRQKVLGDSAQGRKESL